MTAFILAISACLTFFGVNILGLNEKLDPIPLASLYVIVSIFIFLILSFVWAVLVTLWLGKDLIFLQSKFPWEPKSIYKDGEIYEVPILLTIKNRSKYNETICSAYLEKFNIVYDGEYKEADEITKKMKSSNLIHSKVTLLKWHERNWETPDGEMKLRPQNERNIELAWFQFLLNESSIANSGVGRLRLQYHKEEKLLKTQLGLYEFKVAIHYKRNDETETRIEYFDGYLYANIFKEENFEDDIRNKLKGKIVVGDGCWKKNKEIPKPKSR